VFFAKKVKGEKGFTLVELLMVVAIIAILASIAIPRFSKYRLRTYITELESDAKNTYTSAQAYLIDNPSETVDALNKLNSGGFQKSINVHFDSGDITLTGGTIIISHNVLNSSGEENNAVIFYNGRLNIPVTP
jgi:prepilin-type N-terminal cleavage/methylation domain-containing protein